MFIKNILNNIKIKNISGNLFMGGYFLLSFGLNYHCYKYLKNQEYSIYDYYLMIV